MSAPPSVVFARRLGEVRARRRWTQERLAEELTRYGFPLGRTTLAKIEGGKRGVTLDEAFAISAVLSVSPLHMLVPLGDDVLLAILPTRPSMPRVAREWIRGINPLEAELRDGEDWRIYFTERPDNEILLAHATGQMPTAWTREEEA